MINYNDQLQNREQLCLISKVDRIGVARDSKKFAKFEKFINACIPGKVIRWLTTASAREKWTMRPWKLWLLFEHGFYGVFFNLKGRVAARFFSAESERMAEWRFGYGWTDEELNARLAKLRGVDLNFPHTGPESQQGKNWTRYYSESVIAVEPPGQPVAGGPFEIAWKAITEYQFSDPAIVTGHFNPQDPLRGRSMLLELKIFGLRYLCGVRVTAVREKAEESKTQNEFRYETLEGHLEVGTEWFTLTKKHDTGEVWFRISASWRPGHFPNWWSRVGFEVVGHRYQLAWHRLAYLRLRQLAGSGGKDLVPVPYGEKLVHTGADISESELWALQENDVNERVSRSGKDQSECPQSESVTSSSSPVVHPE